MARAAVASVASDTPERILKAALEAFAEQGFDGVRGQFNALFRMVGRRVRVRDFDGAERAGTALGIDTDGALRIRTSDGEESKVIAGDVTLIKEDT